jgi:hypothetical protein
MHIRISEEKIEAGIAIWRSEEPPPLVMINMKKAGPWACLFTRGFSTKPG